VMINAPPSLEAPAVIQAGLISVFGVYIRFWVMALMDLFPYLGFIPVFG
jgi:hypothetical protein